MSIRTAIILFLVCIAITAILVLIPYIIYYFIKRSLRKNFYLSLFRPGVTIKEIYIEQNPRLTEHVRRIVTIEKVLPSFIVVRTLGSQFKTEQYMSSFFNVSTCADFYDENNEFIARIYSKDFNSLIAS